MPSMINIRFVGFQLKRWLRACDRELGAALIETDRLPFRMATDYADLIRVNITTGKYDAAYQGYNLRYYNWKYNVFKSKGGFWKLRGELFKAISVFKHTDGKLKGWMGGIPSGEMDSGNVSWLGKGDKGRRLPIALYARWMEFGRRRQPERPLFQPTLVEYRTGKAIEQFGRSMAKIKGAWR